MTDALWMKRGGTLVPADPWTESMLAALPNETFVHTSAPRQPRNPRHHRKMMAVLSKVVEHTWPRFAGVDELMDYLKLRSGMVKEVYVVDGVVKIVHKSISFSAMDQHAFNQLTEKWTQIICSELLPPGTDPEELLKEASN